MDILQCSQRPITYALHRTRLHPTGAYNCLFPLSRLKSRYPVASYAFGHRLFLTGYMLSSKVVCDDAHSNKASVSYKNRLRNNY